MFEKAPMFIGTMGNSISKLFPGTTDIFLRGKIRDILFDGMPLVCDKDKYKELGMICNFLKSSRPPAIQTTDEPNEYKFSFFSPV